MASNYDKIREENIREYGAGTRHLSFLGRLYTDKTHFIFELLQNAEDAAASKILFTLFEDHLEVRHNGRPFDEHDVRGVCGVGEGTKAQDLTQIGKFGIGFKSVYAYTTTPEIHSGDESFRIEDYVRPYAVRPKVVGDLWTTLFVFVFDASNIDPETARREIGACLRNLSARTLLFLRKIKEINYELPDTDGVYLREEVAQDSARQVEVLGQGNGQEENEKWLIFERPVTIPDNSGNVSVEVGFRIETNIANQTKSIVKINQSSLVVHFPTEKDTKLGFLIQGPYRTTPARDNIPKDDDLNKKLIEETAELVVEALQQFKKMGLLSVSLLEALPIRPDDYSENSMFWPIFSRVRESLISEELLPANDGGFVPAQNAKLVRGAALMKILNQEQLGKLFQSNDEIRWLSDNITKDHTHDLHSYLTKELEIEEVDPEVFARQMSEQFLAAQDDKWFIKFYEFLSDQKALWRPPRWQYDTTSGILRNKPILRLQNGVQVNPFRSNGSPNAYLAVGTDPETSLPIVKVTISSHDEARQFLIQLGIEEVDLVAEVVEQILPKYTDDSLTVESRENKRDLKKIEQAYKTDSQEKLNSLQDALLKTPFILADSPNEEEAVYGKPDEVYFGSAELHIYFSGNDSFTYVSLDHPQESLFKELGVKNAVRVYRRKKDPQGFVCIEDDYGCHKRGLEGFDPDIQVDGLELAVSTPTLEKSAFIWNSIAIPHSDCIRGVVEASTRQTYEGSSQETRLSEFGKLLINTTWLPDSNGNMSRPSDLALEDLPESFTRDEKLADQLYMKKDAIKKLVEEAGMSEEAFKLAKQISESPPEIQEQIASILQEETNKQPQFPQSSSPNPERRQKQFTQQFLEAPKKEYEPRTRSVRITEATENTRTWLKENYTNESHQMICQICKKEMPFKKRNGEYYFEAVETLSKEYFLKEHEAQFLALCPLCAAMYKEFVKRDEDVMQNVKDKIVNSGNSEVTLHLGDHDASIRFVETHWEDIKTILKECD